MSKKHRGLLFLFVSFFAISAFFVTHPSSVSSVILIPDLGELSGTLHVVKVTVPADNTTPFSISASGDGTINDSPERTTLATDHPEDFSVSEGTYSVSETALEGWLQDDSRCQDVFVLDGETVECTITNTKLPTLTLVNTVSNTHGGTKTAADFSLDIDGNATSEGLATIVAIASHTASQTNLAGYLTTEWGGDCAADGTITLAAGENKTCTITNQDQSPHLTVITHIINDHGGSLAAASTGITASGSHILPASSFAGNETGEVISLDANAAYAIETSAQTGYTATLSDECSSSTSSILDLGQNRTCAITYDDIQPKLTVTKVVFNDQGGTKTVADFPLFVGSVLVTSGTETGFSAGNYVVSETSQTGYTQSITGDCAENGSLTLNPGDVKSCTITNNDNAPQVIVSTGGGGGGNSGGGGGNGARIPQTYTITSSAGTGGSINPSGNSTVPSGDSLTFTVTADTGFQIQDVLVDGVSVGAASTYTLENIRANHTIAASFSGVLAASTVAPEPTPARIFFLENNEVAGAYHQAPEPIATKDAWDAPEEKIPFEDTITALKLPQTQVAALSDSAGISLWLWLLLLLIILLILYYLYRRMRSRKK